ncbi:MAG: ABC transporter permease [Candidatus Micrarchaeia archaeon]
MSILDKAEDFFQMALTNFSHRKTRTFLTMIGIFTGIAAVVALIALGSGLQATISGEFAKMGSDKITILALVPGLGANPLASGLSTTPLTEDDVKTVEKAQGVKDAAGAIFKRSRMKFAKESNEVNIAGFPTTGDGKRIFQDSTSLEAETGRLLKSSDKYSIVLGHGVAHEQFDKTITTGNQVEIEGKIFKVIGVAKSYGDPGRDSRNYIPKQIAREIFDEKTLVSMIIAQTDESAVPSITAEKIERKLRTARGLKEGEEDFAVQTAEELLNAVSQIFNVLQAVLVGIAAISLLVGAVGIMNTMYTSVVERTNHIGIMKAVGAKNSDIAMIFLFESGILGLSGGVIGVALGIALSLVGEYTAAQVLGSDLLKAQITPELVIGTLSFAFVIGTISGVLPAMQASKLQPVDSIRSK